MAEKIGEGLPIIKSEPIGGINPRSELGTPAGVIKDNVYEAARQYPADQKAKAEELRAETLARLRGPSEIVTTPRLKPQKRPLQARYRIIDFINTRRS